TEALVELADAAIGAVTPAARKMMGGGSRASKRGSGSGSGAGAAGGMSGGSAADSDTGGR
ncbi:MAG TPA: hypothetical protein VE686_02685, partial [Beijerinckiaceae bacterium]|nr:hypothetical protein [Beijerinckiaceae bacterium]